MKKGWLCQALVHTTQRRALLLSLLIPFAQVHAQTQADMNGQAGAEFEQADAELNKTYEALLKKLRDGQSKEKLKESQRAWLAFRMPRQRLRLIRRVAGQWLAQSAMKPWQNSLSSESNS